MEPSTQQPQDQRAELPTPIPAHTPAPQHNDAILPNHDANQKPPPYEPERPRDPYVPQQPMSATNQPVIPLNQLGEVEAWIDCPFCHQRTRTRVDKVDTSMTFVLGLLLCLICVCLACIPCIAHWFADIDHYCTNCNKKVVHIPSSGVPQVMTPQASRYAAGPNIEAGMPNGGASNDGYPNGTAPNGGAPNGAAPNGKFQ